MEFIAIKRIQSTSTSSLKIKKSSSISGNIKVTFNSGRKKKTIFHKIFSCLVSLQVYPYPTH